MELMFVIERTRFFSLLIFSHVYESNEKMDYLQIGKKSSLIP